LNSVRKLNAELKTSLLCLKMSSMA